MRRKHSKDGIGWNQIKLQYLKAVGLSKRPDISLSIRLVVGGKHIMLLATFKQVDKLTLEPLRHNLG